MGLARIVIIAAGITVAMEAAAAWAVPVTFGPPPPLGTTWTAPGLALTENGIDVFVDVFNFLPTGSTFNFGEIVAPPSPFAVNATQALHTNNVNAVFDFSALPPVNFASIEFVELGGNINFDVNGLGLQNFEDFTSLVSYPDFTVVVNTFPVSGGYGGIIEVRQTGANPIQTFLIGGQELGIDNTNAVPEPMGMMPLWLGAWVLVQARTSLRKS